MNKASQLLLRLSIAAILAFLVAAGQYAIWKQMNHGADFVSAVSLKGLNATPCYDPISHLVHVAGRECVTHVWVAGKCCVDHKKLSWSGQNDLESAITLWLNRLEVRSES